MIPLSLTGTPQRKQEMRERERERDQHKWTGTSEKDGLSLREGR